MLIWIVFAVMTGLAILAILVPLARGRSGAESRSESDIAVYRDQLQAVDEEVERGIISESEAEAARTEISRRLLKAGERRDRETKPYSAPQNRHPRLTVGLAVGVVAVSLGGYLALGSPELPGKPLTGRQARPLDEQDPQILIAKIETYLRQNPDDGKGWDLVAPVYMQLGRFDDAARAFTSALRLLGDSAERFAGLGQALTHSADNIVTAPARDAFERALVLNPGFASPRFYLALALEQKGALKEAAEAWRALLADAPAEAPWRTAVEQQLASVSARLGVEAPGPSAEDMKNAEALSPAASSDMIAQMVARLAERLEAGGGDVGEWVMMMRSYMVLGRDAEAREALVRARARFAADEAALVQIEQAARTLGLAG